MSAFLPLVPVKKEIYAREYLIPAECFPCNEQVTLYAECTHTSESERDCGYYKLSYYFSVGDYPARDHIIDLFWGKQSMSRAEIDATIDDFARVQTGDLFPEMVEAYLKKEELWEQAQLDEDMEAENYEDSD